MQKGSREIDPLYQYLCISIYLYTYIRRYHILRAVPVLFILIYVYLHIYDTRYPLVCLRESITSTRVLIYY